MSSAIRHGMTLIEVVVVLTLLGIIGSVTALTIPRVREQPQADAGQVLAEVRRRALRDGAPVTAQLLIDSAAHEVVVLPDGSVVIDSSVALDRLTARWRHAP